MNSNHLLNDWLEQVNEIALLLAKINRVALALNSKRVTLEEKSIINYFEMFSARLGTVEYHINRLMQGNLKIPVEISANYLENIQRITRLAQQAVDEFLKAFDYNANYLEQYFEHSFLVRLKEELHLVEDIQALASELEAFP